MSYGRWASRVVAVMACGMAFTACAKDAEPGPSPAMPGGGSGGSTGQPGPERDCLFDDDLDAFCGESYVSEPDCNDGDAAIYPGAPEVSNAIDDDCNGVVDDGLTPACPWTVESPAAGCEAGLDIVVGASHACVLTDVGRVLCWGKNNAGVLGTPDIVSSSVPVAVPGVVGATALVGSRQATCALIGESALCWGAYSAYPFTIPLPAGTTQIALTSTLVDDGSQVDTIHALDDAGQAWQRPFFEAGAASLEFAMGLSGLKALVGGGSRLCAIDLTDALVCADGAAMVPVVAGPVELAVTTESDGLCYKTGGALYCSAGDGSNAVEIAGNASAVGVAVSNAFACAFNDTGRMACWTNGPTSVADAAAVAIGPSFGCVLHQAGHVSCWGDGDGGMLGDAALAPHTAVEPISVTAGPVLGRPGPVLLGAAPLGACDSVGDLSVLIQRASGVHAALAGCSAQCASTLDAAACFAECAMSPGLSAGCFGCYVNLATCSGPDCYANFNTCAGFPVDFARAIHNEPRFECLGAGCLRGAAMGEPCEKPGDCASQQCTSLPHAPDAKVCTASDGSMCYADSPFCGSCELGTDNYYGYGHCGGCFTTGRIESGTGQCFRDCSTTSFCMAGQMCRNFSNSQTERYCD